MAGNGGPKVKMPKGLKKRPTAEEIRIAKAEEKAKKKPKPKPKPPTPKPRKRRVAKGSPA